MAALPIQFLAEAIEETREARLWYAARSQDAARRFADQLDRAVDQIRESPSRWPRHLYGTQRYRLHRFPFLLIYRVKSDHIEIVACQHARRRPGYWQDRMDA